MPTLTMKETTWRQVLRWPHVEEGVSAFGSRPAFSVGGKEFAHFHSAQELDIRLPYRQLRAIEGIQRNPYTGAWSIYTFDSKAGVEKALELLRRAYEAAKDK